MTNSDDRWALPRSSISRFSIGMVVVLVASLALHAFVVTLASLNDRTATAQPDEPIAVEIVKQMPMPQSAPKAPAHAARTEAVPLRNESSKLDAAPESAKPVLPEPVLPKPVLPKPVVPKPSPPKTAPAEAQKDTTDDTLKTLEKQFEALKAERAALEKEQTAEVRQPTPPARTMSQPAATGMGPLPDSFQAIALPATSNGDGEAVGYQQIVFSQLALANEIGKTQGVPGSSGVHFEIDEAGKLISAEVVVPSGVPSLDAMALAIVRKAAPFPPPPQGALRSFDANVNFVAETAP